jgi:hypothetical protein
MPPKLNVGDIVTTVRDPGPYRVRDIMRGCTCKKFMSDLPIKPHMHITVETLDGVGPHLLNGFDEETLESVWEDDRLTILPPDAPVQTSLF